MTPTTLQALRRLLFFSIPEAAEHIGGVTERSWRKWESGERTIPDDVRAKIMYMLDWRETTLESGIQMVNSDRRIARLHRVVTMPKVTWYTSPEAWAIAEPGSPELWRPHCSVVAELCAKHGAEAVPSD